jgi:phosphatidate cytidylyltransferase
MSEGKFSDLTARVASAIVMTVVGVADIWAGGPWFLALCALVAGLIVWELTRMVDPGARLAVPLGLLAAGALVAAALLRGTPGALVLAVPAVAGLVLLRANRPLFVGYALMAMVASFGLYHVRVDHGLVWIAWLILVVVVSDVAGYFAGRIIGGPKFWPKVSPKKTWSGTVAGWVGAVLVALVVTRWTGAGAGLIPLSVALALAGQMGDIGESAIKRRMGVKDSSNLIPGHGGVMDRFDAMLGASVFLVLAEAAGFFPPGSAA